MSAPEEQHIGEGTEWDQLVSRIREMDDPERDQQMRVEKSRSYDQGYVDGIDAGIRMVKAETRALRRRHVERLSDTFRHWKRTAIEETLIALLLIALPLITVALLKGG